MRCPYCNTSLFDNSEECPSCMLTFPRTCKVAGTLPRLEHIVADNARVLSGSDVKGIKKRIAEIKERFPQTVMQVATLNFPKEHPFSMYAFWVMNVGDFAGKQNRGAKNYSVLILLDPSRQESAISQGYGFENRLPDPAIDHLLVLAGPHFAAGKWAKGIHVLLDGLEMLFESVATEEHTEALADEF